MRYTLGIDIGGTNIKAGLVHKENVIKRIGLKTKAEDGPDRCLAQIKSIIRSFNNISKIGIGIAGIIDSQKGIVRYSPNLKGWYNIKLAEPLKKEFKTTIRILNDVNAILLGEWIYGAGKGYKNIFLFTLGTGVGGAAVCEGKLLFGASGFAGEFGHTVINFNGPECACGNYGCLERYVGSRHIVEIAKKKIAEKRSNLKNYKDLTPKIIANEAKKGDAVAKEVFEEIGYYIGIGVSNIINLFDPEVVIISGGISRAGKILFEPIRRTIRERVLGLEYRNLKIVPAKLGDDAGILGAAHFADYRFP
uniref:ROK family protein n=1 Tax=candidate division WOR-3 bacterium TaxID=2052148 RepID=A0A7V0Z549_UNCW3